MTTTSGPDRLAGAVWGHLVGDAVGVPYEFKSAASIGTIMFGATGTHRQPPGTWSDDGGLMLSLLDSLLTCGFDTADQGRRAVEWFRKGSYTPDGTVFDIGTATQEALQALERGVLAEDAGPSHERASGNGSLMRILPLALVMRDEPDAQLVALAHRASRVTHGTAHAQVACALYVVVARRLLVGASGASRAKALGEARTAVRSVYSNAGGSAENLAALDHLERWTERCGRGFVTDSFWSAWDAFAGADSYRATIERAVAYGEDTDTTAAIAGGLAGIRWGIGGIPAEWLAGMRGAGVATPLVDRLVETTGWRTSTGSPIRVDWVELASVPGLAGASGRLGMTFLPGKRREGLYGKHWRDLAVDAAGLHNHSVDDLLLLVEDHELRESGVADIGAALEKAGVVLHRHPIVDTSVPADRAALKSTLDKVRRLLADGRWVAVACHGGLGRTGTVVACLLRDGGLSAADAMALTRASRAKTIENVDQERFVEAWQ